MAGRPGAGPGVADTVVATVNGEAVSWEELRARLAEAAGGLVLGEVALDRLLERELASRGIDLSDADVAGERGILVDSLRDSTLADEEGAERLVERIRRERGLGPRRFAELLRRNAAMRALVRAGVEVTPADVRLGFELRHGEKLRARVILAAQEREAARVLGELKSGHGPLSARFGEAAARFSIDPSASRGGMLEPLSAADPSYPEVVRRVLTQLRPGELSGVVGVDDGFAILLLEERLPPDRVAFEDVEERMRELVRRRLERIAMDELARSLLGSARISVIDRGVEWSWRVQDDPPLY